MRVHPAYVAVVLSWFAMGFGEAAAGPAELSVCGNGVVEGEESCDDGNESPGDGCSGVCAVEEGFECPAGGGTCQDVDECWEGTHSCVVGPELCLNLPGGYECVCSSGHFLGETGCEACAPGSYAPEAGMDACILCSPGYYRFQSGGKECKECPPGSFSGDDGASQCTPCEPGTTTSSTASVMCEPCAPGSYYGEEGGTECILCQAGEAAGDWGMAACEVCPAGSVSVISGAAECSPCPAGQYRPADLLPATKCNSCLPGSVAPEPGAAQCALCEPGSYAGQWGMEVCELCGPGQYASGQGSTKCTDCPAGKVTAEAGSSSCTPCAAGQFAPFSGGTYCLLCGVGRMSPEGSSECLLCEPGHYASQDGSAECTPCAPGSYAASEGAAGCTSCAAGSFASESGQAACTACEAGSAQPQVGATSCGVCLVGSYADKQGAKVCLQCQPGSYAASQGSASCELCLAGQYQGYWGQSSCLPCGENSFSSEPGSAQCQPCPEGFFSLQEASECLPECGDGVEVAGEECDDGNLEDGDCCSALCTFEGAGTMCGSVPGDCVLQGVCDGAGGCVYESVPDGTLCDDGDACNGIHRCLSGVCTMEEGPQLCLDVPVCHEDGHCDPATGLCEFEAVEDGMVCSGGEFEVESGKCRWGQCLPLNEGDSCENPVPLVEGSPVIVSTKGAWSIDDGTICGMAAMGGGQRFVGAQLSAGQYVLTVSSVDGVPYGLLRFDSCGLAACLGWAGGPGVSTAGTLEFSMGDDGPALFLVGAYVASSDGEFELLLERVDEPVEESFEPQVEWEDVAEQHEVLEEVLDDLVEPDELPGDLWVDSGLEPGDSADGAGADKSVPEVSTLDLAMEEVDGAERLEEGGGASVKAGGGCGMASSGSEGLGVALALLLALAALTLRRRFGVPSEE